MFKSSEPHDQSLFMSWKKIMCSDIANILLYLCVYHKLCIYKLSLRNILRNTTDTAEYIDLRHLLF
jgi:hypothetical protein